MSTEPCSWCRAEVPVDDGFRLADRVHRRRAVFCRLEHVVPWVMQNGRWSGATGLVHDDAGAATGRCAECGGGLGDDRILLVRHRGVHRIADAFCGLEHVLAWAKGGGRWKLGGRS